MSEFSIDTPSADRGHEAIRLAVVQAIADTDSTKADTDDSFQLVDTLFSLLDAANAAIDDLSARVAALEAGPGRPAPANKTRTD